METLVNFSLLVNTLHRTSSSQRELSNMSASPIIDNDYYRLTQKQLEDGAKLCLKKSTNYSK